jgi:hypothetical protein
MTACYEILEPGRAGITPNGDVWVKQWLIDWCDKNLTTYRIEYFYLTDGNGARRLGLILDDISDIMLFKTRWEGELRPTERNGNLAMFGPYSADEMLQEFLPHIRSDGRGVSLWNLQP